MPNAVRNFGLMPISGFSKEQFEAAATYLYYAELEKPDWYEKVFQKEKEELLKYTETDTTDYLKKGRDLALSTKAVLGKNLLSAIREKGTDGALQFCSDRAITLTDSMALALDAKIKRVSDQNRNPGNSANDNELAYILQAKSEIEQEGKAKPKVFEKDSKMIGYYPILTNTMCLQCHGKPESNIKNSTLSLIHQLYPEDRATGYSENELRGIWVIEMEK